jgi:MFS family permease
MLLGLTLFGAYREFAGSLTCLTSDLGSGTIACAIAPSMETLILARAVAGMGGGGYVVTGSFLQGSLMLHLFQSDDRQVGRCCIDHWRELNPSCCSQQYRYH